MDSFNMRNIALVEPGDGKARIAMLLDLVPGREGSDLADPWYGGEDNFRDTWDDVTAGTAALVALLR